MGTKRPLLLEVGVFDFVLILSTIPDSSIFFAKKHIFIIRIPGGDIGTNHDVGLSKDLTDILAVFIIANVAAITGNSTP